MVEHSQTRPRSRDAHATKRDLLTAATRRFARQGYVNTTLREIAGDVGVSVGLVNRYFNSKQSLFEQCLAQALATTQVPALVAASPTSVAEIIASEVTDASAGLPGGDVLLLLLRASGIAETEQARVRALNQMADLIHELIPPHVPDSRLRAQLVQATAIGVFMLHTTEALGPLAHASYDELLPPLRDMILAALEPHAGAS